MKNLLIRYLQILIIILRIGGVKKLLLLILKIVDFDDGFGIEPYLKNNEQIGWRVSIYIANVFLWLETLDLWKTLVMGVATIYLPDRKRPMLPTVLSDTLCSLQENQNRFALAMDIYIDMEVTF